MKIPFAVLVLVQLSVAPCRALRAEDGIVPFEGHRLAVELCSECHVVERDEPDAFEIVPTFSRIAADANVTEVTLRLFLRTPHWSMPEIILNPEETAEIVAYILSLQPPR